MNTDLQEAIKWLSESETPEAAKVQELLKKYTKTLTENIRLVDETRRIRDEKATAILEVTNMQDRLKVAQEHLQQANAANETLYQDKRRAIDHLRQYESLVEAVKDLIQFYRRFEEKMKREPYQLPLPLTGEGRPGVLGSRSAKK